MSENFSNNFDYWNAEKWHTKKPKLWNRYWLWQDCCVRKT